MQQLMAVVASEIAAQTTIKIPFFVLNPDIKENSGKWSTSVIFVKEESGALGQSLIQSGGR
jgi:hypothetical protein